MIMISGSLSIFLVFSVALIVIIVETTFFQRKFGVNLSHPGPVDSIELHLFSGSSLCKKVEMNYRVSNSCWRSVLSIIAVQPLGH